MAAFIDDSKYTKSNTTCMLGFYNDKIDKYNGLYNEGTIRTRSLTYRSFTSRRLLYQTRAQDFNKRNHILLAISTYIQASARRNQEIGKETRNRLRTSIIV
jgi:hypothetical protein